uniref:Uncharacterized protein n=1 Tax=Siphoviridae sp. ctOiG6 TaxID=2826313 RepID=A0A8S5N1R9_9CAUD|nr:MAG TPA: hypothetical protein [Siphoviridae sp. ctOiG6]
MSICTEGARRSGATAPPSSRVRGHKRKTLTAVRCRHDPLIHQ